ncbi:protein suppressor of hairy wing-like [Anopheles coustani]|nr:protein suppressor of hairy wing-like [Anopheles coustani]
MAQRVAFGKKKAGKMLVNVHMNADDEIDVVPIDAIVSENKVLDDEDSDGDSTESLDSDPELVQTKDGRLVLSRSSKNCPKCKKPLKTSAELAAHRPKCPGTLDKVTEVILKEKKAAKHANPSEEFSKYCNPNPENPCYCCGEDVSTAHVGHIRCQFCPKSFKAFEYLDRHISSVHAESDDFPCEFCNAKCPSAEILAEHQKIHSEGKPHSCTICGKEFTRRYHLDRHAKHSNCGSDQKFHLPCEVCGKEFTRVDNLREHLRTHLGQTGRKRDYQCPYCPKSFYGSSLLNIHIRTHTGEKPFPCDLCPKSFPSSGALRKHRRKHTGERPYKCDDCSATFSARETLNRHRKRHTGDKPHECKECGKRFIQATQLRTHMFVHTGTASYKCKECDQAFPRSSKLNEHIKYEHRGEQPFECNECGKRFLDRAELNRHMAVHMTQKEFQCHCGNSYTRKASLKAHMKTHSSEEPVTCKICTKTFIRTDCLLRHMKKQHAEAVEELIQCTEKRKEEELQVPSPATVEINGEVFEITTMGESTKQPKFVLPDPNAGRVMEVYELPPIVVPEAVTSPDEPVEYELVPIAEETEVEIYSQEEALDDLSPGNSEGVEILPTIKESSPKTKPDPEKTNKEASSSGKNVDGANSASVKILKPKLAQEPSPAHEPSPIQEPKLAAKIERAREKRSTPSNKSDKLPTEPPKPTPVEEKAKEIKPKSPKVAKELVDGVKEPVKRRKTREPKTATGAKRSRTETDDSIPIFLSDEMLSEKIAELLLMLVGEEMLQEFGWPETPVEDLLCQVILRCGHRPTKGEEAGDNTTRMRENTKILFSVTMDEEDIKPLLNNHTVDEVIMHVLKSK